MYNPHERVKDGPIWASRVWHHVIKVMTGMTVYAIALTLFRLFGWQTIWLVFVGIAIEIVVQVKEWKWPTDPAVRPMSDRIPDWATDSALYSMAGVLELLAHAEFMFAFLFWGVLMTSYMVNRSRSRP